MIISIKVKQIEYNGSKFAKYSCYLADKWFDVVFCQSTPERECTPAPRVYKIDKTNESIQRAYIKLTQDDTTNWDYVFDKVKKNGYKSNVIYVKTYIALTGEELKKAIAIDQEKIKKAREEHEKGKVDLLIPHVIDDDIDDDIPF